MAVFVLSLLILSSFSAIYADSGMIGVNYGRIADNLPAPEKVVELLKTQGINRVKLYDTDKSVLTALTNSGIKVVVSLPNENLSAAAKDQSYTDNWVQENVKKYMPATDIVAIAVGNEVFVDPRNTTTYLVPAMKNVQSSLVKFNLDKSIKISSPIALSALANSYPPSAGSFKPDLIEPVIKPMLDLLRKTSSHLMVNAYPFFAYAANADKISLDYALFKENAGNVDSGNGLKYNSLLDAQIDAVFAAMAAVGFNDVKLVVTETGWPSAGDENEIGAGSANAAAYNGGLVKRVLTGNGTPLKPNEPLDVYLFALFNENQKTGPTSERNYGLFYPNENKVYDVPFNVKSTPVSDSKEKVPVKSHVGQTWCVANGNTKKEKLQEGLDYACGEGGADCRPIQPGATCYNPESLEAHASYAFNSYYQKNARGVGTCDFGGAAYVVSQPPKVNKDRNKAVRRGSGKRKRTTKKETDKKVVKRSRASKPEEEIKYFVEKRNLEDLWKVAFPVGLEWDQLDALINKFNWDFKNLEEAFEEGGILYGKKTYVFVNAEPLHIHYKDGIDIVQVPTVVVIESPFPPSDKIAVGSVQGAMQQIIPMKQMKMDWLPYIPFQNRDRQVDRMDFQIFILSCTQRRSALRHLKEDRAMMFQYCVPYFYNPLVEDELEQSTVVNIVFPSESPVVCDFDWDVDLLEDFVDELIEEERLSVEQKDEFKEFVKERVRAGMRANREARDARRKAREEMSEETKEAFHSIKFYKFYPRSSPVVPSFMKSSYISRYYPKPHQVVL